MADAKADNPSMEDILNTIRGVIAGDEEVGPPDQTEKAQQKAGAQPQAKQENDQQPEAADEVDDDEDVLELTDIIEEDGDAMPEAPTPEAEDNNSEGLLNDIDNMIDGDDEMQDDAPSDAVPAEEMIEAAEPAPQVPTQEEALESDVIPAAEEEYAPEPEPEPQPQQEAPTESAPQQSASDRLVSETAAAASQAVLKEMMSAVPRQKVSSPATRGGTTLEDLVIEAIRPYLTEWMDKNLATIVKQLVEKEIKHLIPRDVE